MKTDTKLRITSQEIFKGVFIIYIVSYWGTKCCHIQLRNENKSTN